MVGNDTPYSLFISDLHLCSSRPVITQQFLTFLQTEAVQAQALYILGDLFEYWAGDDDVDDAHHQAIIAGLHRLAATGTNIFFMHGNRDFLLEQVFADATGIQLLHDPTIIDLHGKRALLSHGDVLCTDDVDYQAFRRLVRASAWQAAFLATPLTARKTQIEILRQRSELEKSYKSESIMDVNPDAVNQLIKDYDYPELLIHGHTHRPALHQLKVDGHACQRWVLGDWYEQGSCLRCNATGCSSHVLDQPNS